MLHIKMENEQDLMAFKYKHHRDKEILQWTCYSLFEDIRGGGIIFSNLSRQNDGHGCAGEEKNGGGLNRDGSTTPGKIWETNMK